MRKQTKLVAVLSTAALLALGASMSSFAATGWQEENGTWVYYDKSGDKETEKWEKSGDNWFYLNENGEMSTDAVVEYSDNYYYVDENGSMVANKWVSVENNDHDGDDKDEPTNHWYYFGANGKAYKTSTSSSTASFKTVNGKNYVFDEDGKMLYGWINKEGTRETGDDAWKEGVYYCGDENDGAQNIGWKFIDIIDEDYNAEPTEGFSSKNTFDDENQTRWFYFKGNGKRIVDEKGKTINGKKYSFDILGRMNAEWVAWDATPSRATASQGTADYTSSWRFYGSPEDGARVTKGWFKVVPDESLQKGKFDDDEDYWYYSDKDGKLVASEIKTINGKKYLFDNFGRMKDGLKFVKFAADSTTDIAETDGILSDDDRKDAKFDTVDNYRNSANTLLNDTYHAFYFGNGDDGSMKTGKQSLSIDGEAANFSFVKSGSFKGEGKTGVDSDKYYLAGMLLKADKDDKYAVIEIDKSVEGKVGYSLLTTDEFVKKVGGTKTSDKNNSEIWNINYNSDKVDYKLVNTAGSVQSGKTKAKDGNDRCYSQKGQTIVKVFVEK